MRGLNASLGATKKNAGQIVDSLTQREIDQLPDRSLAEVLDRLPGVSSDRGFSSSNARTVTIRGFDARYNSMDVDSNVVWNSSRNNRGTQLDVFPAAVINQIDVYKTVLPDQDANSVGGHLTLRTLRAFDGGPGTLIKAQAAYGLYAQDKYPASGGPSLRTDGVAKFTFGPQHQFGMVIGGEFQQHRFYDRYNEVTAYTQIGGDDVVNGDIFHGIFPSKQERAALYGKLESRSEDQYYAFLSASWFNDRLAQSFNRGGTFITATRVTGATGDGGSFERGVGETYFEQYRLNRETLLLGSGLDYRIGDTASVTLRGAHTRYTHDEDLFRSERFQLSGLSGSYDLDQVPPSVSLNAASLAAAGSPASWLQRTGRPAFDQAIPHHDNVYNGSAEINWNGQETARGFGLIGGMFWRRLDRRFDQTTLNYTLATGQSYRLSDVLDPAAGTQQPNGTDPVFIDRAAYIAYITKNGAFTRDDALTTDYRLHEDVLAGHLSGLWTTSYLRLLAGLRVEKTSVDNGSASAVSGTIVPQQRRSDYTNVLPNVQLAVQPLANVKARLSFTETLARPDFADFANGTTVSFNAAGVQIVSGANPKLGPRRSRNYDASIEWYFRGGFLSLGLFRKELSDETFRQVRNSVDANGVLTLIETIPLNTGSARLNGLELSLVKERFDFLPGPLGHLGFSGNYTLLDGQWKVVFTDGARRTVDGLRNQPRWLANLKLTYAQGPFGANIGYRLRGRTFTGSFGATAAQDIWIDAYARLDAQASLRVLPRTTLFAEGRNLTNSEWVEQTGLTARSTATAISQGRSFWFGIKMKI
ncbi:TonB-dependent receptor [Sphingomonas morindae]|uniref:TonB-dependent receptor n=1 Tax=Sphingomonas morindae TaxID=1541170 RepID=A0ABY4X966_9SPHN|nr:TonB-dependent receptor [Sphingomonas morindae]USI73465.1 TonB-dependent receptor [Sphingomonas morindae]